jgi:probable rRNA maturation factor
LTVIDIQRQSPRWRAFPGATAAARKAARAALAQAGVAVLPTAAVAIALADDAMVRAANRDFRAKDEPTNVLSFPAVPPGRLAAAPFLGDVILACETVAAEAEAEGKPVLHHLAHLVAHGVLHLLGYDHMTKAEAETMERCETLILASLGLPDPYAGSAPLEN